MQKITSFTVDHIRLEKGLYVSRTDDIDGVVLTTFDLRMKLPNREMLSNKAIHTLEHLIATFVRNHKDFGQKIIYFGPMGCLTGMYLIVSGQLSSQDILPLLLEAFDFVVDFEGDIPGVSEIECGNAELHSLEEAKEEARHYLDVLKNATESTLNYPKPQ